MALLCVLVAASIFVTRPSLGTAPAPDSTATAAESTRADPPRLVFRRPGLPVLVPADPADKALAQQARAGVAVLNRGLVGSDRSAEGVQRSAGSEFLGPVTAVVPWPPGADLPAADLAPGSWEGWRLLDGDAPALADAVNRRWRLVNLLPGSAEEADLLRGHAILAAGAAEMARRGSAAATSPAELWTVPAIWQLDSPFLGWRLRLLLAARGLLPVGGGTATGPSSGPATGITGSGGDKPIESAVGRVRKTDLDAVARERLLAQAYDEMALALGKLERVDEELARRVGERLLLCVDLPGEGISGPSVEVGRLMRVPVLSRSHAADRRLALELCAAPDGPAARELASRWLAAQSLGAVLITDDHGLRNGISRQPIVAMLLCNFAAKPALVRAGPGDAIDAVAAFSGVIARAELPADATRAGTEARLSLTLAGNAGEYTVAAPDLKVRPPGLRIGPFISDLAAEQLFGGELSVAGPSLASAHLWFDRSSGRWMLSLSAQMNLASSTPATSPHNGDLDPAQPSAPRWEVWTGPTGRRRVVDAAAPSQRAGRWNAEVSLDPADIQDGLLQLGLVLTGAAPGGQRWSWPRAMLPWQVRPGSITLDLSDWDNRKP